MTFGVLQFFSWPERRVPPETAPLEYLTIAPLSFQFFVTSTETVLPTFL